MILLETQGARPLERTRRPILSLPRLWALVVLAGVWIVLNLTLIRPHDFWWHVRAGQWIAAQGRLPAVDLFSYTFAGQPYVYQRWLMELVLYGLLRAGGEPLVLFVHAVAITAAYGLVLALCRSLAGGNLRMASAAALAAAAVGLGAWNVRPQTASFPLFALTLYLLDRESAGTQPGERRWGARWAAWALPLLFALWANLHGGFVYGLVLLGATLAGRLVEWLRKARRFPAGLLAITLLCAAATLLTPLGLGMVDAVLGLLEPLTQALSAEFQPPTVRQVDGLLFFAFALGLVVLLLASRYRPRAVEAFRLLAFGVLGLTAARNTPWFGLAAAPVVAAALHHWAPQRARGAPERPGRPLLNLATALLVAMLAALSLPWLRPQLPLPESRRAYVSPETPVQAAAFLKALPQPRRVFHSEGFGSYLIWAAPEIPVFVDPRFELYPAALWADYLAASRARYDWQEILDRHGVDTLFLEREAQGPLIEAAAASATWERLYEDATAVVFGRRSGP